MAPKFGSRKRQCYLPIGSGGDDVGKDDAPCAVATFSAFVIHGGWGLYRIGIPRVRRGNILPDERWSGSYFPYRELVIRHARIWQAPFRRLFMGYYDSSMFAGLDMSQLSQGLYWQRAGHNLICVGGRRLFCCHFRWGSMEKPVNPYSS